MRFASAVALAPTLAALAAAAPAGATESCSFDSADALLTIGMTDGGDRVRVYVSGGDIHVERVVEDVGPVPLSCNAQASQTTVDTIRVRDNSDGSTALGVLDPAEFGPGDTPETFGEDEIEWDVSMGPGNKDMVFASDLNGISESWRYGDLGININPTGTTLTDDREYDLRGVDRIEALGGNGQDTISGEGGAGTGTPFPGRMFVQSGNDPDFVFGGSGNDVLDGYFGDDSVNGEAGNDRVEGDAGEDTLRGQGGIDKLNAEDLPARADAEITGGRGDTWWEWARRDAHDPAAISC